MMTMISIISAPLQIGNFLRVLIYRRGFPAFGFSVFAAEAAEA
jgi:hypothetical protein